MDVVLTSFLTNTFEVRLLPPFIRRIKGSLFVHEFVYFSTISNFRSRYDKIRAKLAGCSKADNQPGCKSQIINHRKILRKYSTIKDYISLSKYNISSGHIYVECGSI